MKTITTVKDATSTEIAIADLKKKLEVKTVKELREIMGERGLPKQANGKKFTKPELIERILLDEAELLELEEGRNNHDQNSKKDAGYAEGAVDWSAESEERKPEKTKDNGYISFATTMAEIEQKYGSRKKQEIYDKVLAVGSLVVFVHYVEAKDGNIYKKLRSAKVTKINREKELVKVSTILGTEVKLTFDELLYIRGKADNCTYPKDIQVFLRNQRSEKGRALMYEKFSESNGNN